MLQYQTIAKPTLELLKELMDMPSLADFVLVGGTNIALRLGHRVSIDLDLFSNSLFDTNDLLPELMMRFPTILVGTQRSTSLQCWINEIKVDIVLHRYPWINAIEIIDGLRMASVPDIIAMKLNAIAQRGAQKDFWDIAFLIQDYSILQMLEFYQNKYTANDVYFIIRSLTWFSDAENKMEHMVIPIKTVTWNEIKSKIEFAVMDYLNSAL